MSRLFRPLPRRDRFWAPVVGFLVLLVLWSVLTYGSLVKPYFLSTPSAVIAATKTLFHDRGFALDVLISTRRISAGLLVSWVLAVPLGIALGVYSIGDALFSPLLSFARYLPVPALLPFCILWFGILETEKVVVVVLGVFLQLVFMVADVVKRTPSDYIDVAKTFGASDQEILRTIVIPNAAPEIFDLMRTTSGWAWGWLLVAELVGANRGIGFTILRSQRFLLNAEMIVGLLVVGLLGLLTDFLFRVLKPRFFEWET